MAGRLKATPNVSSVWNASEMRYEITISHERYSIRDYVTVVTPIGGPWLVRSDSLGGKLLVKFTKLDGEPVHASFHFATFRP